MPTHLNRPIFVIIPFLLLLATATATATAAATSSSAASRNVRGRHVDTQRVHPYYAPPPNCSCDSFSRPYARSMCIELQRLHRTPQPPPPPPPPEIDPRFGVEKRLVPSGPNPLHN